jgi:hypothetical protein
MGCGHRDPLDCHIAYGPSTFSLDADELRREANRLVAAGWSVAEVCVVLDVQPVVAS